MIEYRKATMEDVRELARIRSIFLCANRKVESEAVRSEKERANFSYFERALADDSFVAWLAVDNGAIVGTSGLCFWSAPPSMDNLDGRTAYIMNIYTIPDYRKKGIASELLNRIVQEAIERGYHTITLNATSMGRPLYERYGFKDVTGDMVYRVGQPDTDAQ